jgi:hypothetical protein
MLVPVDGPISLWSTRFPSLAPLSETQRVPAVFIFKVQRVRRQLLATSNQMARLRALPSVVTEPPGVVKVSPSIVTKDVFW